MLEAEASARVPLGVQAAHDPCLLRRRRRAIELLGEVAAGAGGAQAEGGAGTEEVAALRRSSLARIESARRLSPALLQLLMECGACEQALSFVENDVLDVQTLRLLELRALLDVGVRLGQAARLLAAAATAPHPHPADAPHRAASPYRAAGKEEV